MKGIRANQKNYKKAFQKHRRSYEQWEKGCDVSRRLVLCYCVECGLKYLIMKENRIESVADADEGTGFLLGSHDFRQLLKAVDQSSVYRFQEFKTEYGDTVKPNNFHQLCRYCIEAEKREMNQVKEYEKTLVDITKWLAEEI